MFDLSAEELRTSLAETISWCATQTITARLVETPELRRRRSLLGEGVELTRRAVASSDRFWNKILRRDHTRTPEWKMGMELIHQAQQVSINLLREELRSMDLTPSRALGEVRTEEEKENLVQSVIFKRSGLLRSRGGLTLPNIGADLCGGRLLTYIPEENLADGAAEFESNGFFDVENAPPWDTWVAYSEHTLLSWVLADLVQLVQRGIDVNPEECIRWIS